MAEDKQYIQLDPDQKWQEIRNNRCARFVTVYDDLFCAFVIKGEEINSPERTDYTYGWFFLVPIGWWSHSHASKLVLAKESDGAWVVQAVVDPDTDLDADDDFLLESDNQGNLHFLYYVSRGGSRFFFFAYGYRGGGDWWSPGATLRYSKISSDQLFSTTIDKQTGTSEQSASQIELLTVQGSTLIDKPMIIPVSVHRNSIITLRPLNKTFSIDTGTGELNGLMYADSCALDDGHRELSMRDAWVKLSIRDGKWVPGSDFVTTRDFPSPCRWRHAAGSSIKTDPSGKKHAMLISTEVGGWKYKWFMNYFVKHDAEWSAPMKLGSSDHINPGMIAVDNSGAAFATWVNGEGIFVGRWIKPRISGHR